MLWKKRRKVARGNPIPCVMYIAVAAADDIEVARIDGNAIVYAVGVRYICIIVLRTPKRDVRQIDGNCMPAEVDCA